MPQLMLITELSLSETDNRQVDDVVNIFDDSWEFCEHEKKIFRIVKTTTKKEVLEAAFPKTVKFPDPIMPVQYEAWQDCNGNWKRLLEKPRFDVRWEGGQVKENFSRIQANTENPVEMRELG